MQLSSRRTAAVKFRDDPLLNRTQSMRGWQLLMDEALREASGTYLPTNVERAFRQVLTNTVMATDIADRRT
jgi:hypothetical protein